MTFIFLFEFSIFSRYPNEIRKQNVYFVEWRYFPFFLTGAITAVLLTACQDSNTKAEFTVMPANTSPSSLRQRRVVMKEYQEQFGDLDKCLTSVKSLVIIAPGHPLQQKCFN